MPPQAWAILPENLDNLYLFLALGSLSAAVVGLAKAGFGGGMGILSTPLMIYACNGKPELALGVMLPILIACDVVAVVSWWGKWNRKAIVPMLPGVLLGVVLGSAAIYAFQGLGFSGRKELTAAGLKLAIGVIALGFVALQSLRALRKNRLAFRPVFWQGASAGTVAGFTSTLAHAGGPIVTMYLLPQDMPKQRFVASTVLFYWIGNWVKVPFYVALGLIHFRSLAASVLMFPAVVGGALLGIYLHHRVGQRSFTGLVYVLLALAGVHLCYGSIAALWP